MIIVMQPDAGDRAIAAVEARIRARDSACTSRAVPSAR